jgi:hypothetical protein
MRPGWASVTTYFLAMIWNRDLGSDKKRNKKGYLSLESCDGHSVKGPL